MIYLITGSAGFIGFHLAKKLSKKYKVIGIDNHNSYYSKKIKADRVKLLKKNKNYIHIKLDLKNKNKFDKVCKKFKVNFIIHLAAQAGVRYSLQNPEAYIKNNINYFFNVIDVAKDNKINGFLFASTSSVYGKQKKRILDEELKTDSPLSLYAATKKADEIISSAYSQLYSFPIVGLRFFNVYGPWGRPDMALYKFTENILLKKKIDVFNYGNHNRDFTFIDDIISGIICAIDLVKKKKKMKYFSIYNLAAGKPISLRKFIKILEKQLGIIAKKRFLPMQTGDVENTFGSIKKLKKIGYQPKTNINDGIKKFVDWFKKYKNIR